MAGRKSIDIESYGHSNPIPSASVIGNLMATGVILPRYGKTGAPPATLPEQAAIIFEHMKSLVEKAGGTTDNILKVNFWMKTPNDREAVNAEWVKMFPVEDARPTRHTFPDMQDGPFLIRAEFIAVL